MSTVSTLSITINTPRTVAQLQQFIRDPSNNHEECKGLEHLFRRLGAGLESASFAVQTSANPPAAATGTVTLTNASIVANDTLTIAGVAFTAKASGATGAQFNIGGTATITAANIVAAVNASAAANVLVVASSVAGVVTVTSLAQGAVGNFVPMATSNGTGFVLSAATLAGGTGGPQTVATVYNKGR